MLAIFSARNARMLYLQGHVMPSYLASRRAKMLAMMSIIMGSVSFVIYYFSMRQRERQMGPL
jgi:hypothetical protein